MLLMSASANLHCHGGYSQEMYYIRNSTAEDSGKYLVKARKRVRKMSPINQCIIE